MIPVLIKEMNTNVFIFSGLVSLVFTLVLILVIYIRSPSTRTEIGIWKIFGIIFTTYITINLFYFFNLIPPVPLALDRGIVAHNITVENNNYTLTYETDEWFVFWREHRLRFIHVPGENVYVFTSIFAPTEIEKLIFHRWKWYNNRTSEWEIVEDLGYKITGGRNEGYRGYTFKNNTRQGLWKVEVITEEGLIIGVIDFEIVINNTLHPIRVVNKVY
jgi:hypothetical protein